MPSVEQLLPQICRPVTQCPVCQSSHSALDNEHKRNRYSEEIALLLQVDEDELLRAIKCLRCSDCGLGYKSWWFKPEFFYKVFVEAAPTHSHGWNSISGRFTPEQFAAEVDHLSAALKAGDVRASNKYRRTLQSFVANVDKTVWRNQEAAALHTRFRTIDLDHMTTADATFLKRVIAPLIRKPRAFGRYSGFGHAAMEEFVRKHVSPLRVYGEIGCPLWGLFRRFASDITVDKIFVRDEEQAFWGPQCCDGGSATCAAWAVDHFRLAGTATMSELAAGSRRLDVLTVINYLDHLASPLSFLKQAVTVADHLLIVSFEDRPELQGYIQHNSSFNERVLQYMASRLGMRIVESMPSPEGAEDEVFTMLLGKV